MRAALWIGLGLAGYVAVEAGVFHTRVYSHWLNADSSAGLMDIYLTNEQRRYAQGPAESHRADVLVIGDSRMTLMPRVANELTPETGYTFATIAIAGSTPRCWYYMLRETDPRANRYAAVVIGLENYDDQETLEDRSKRASDLNYVLPYLELKDLAEFAGSYPLWEERARAARGILFKGTIYQQDVFDFLQNPRKRVHDDRVVRRESARWYYDYSGVPTDDTDVAIDFDRHSIQAGANRSATQLLGFRQRYLDPLPQQQGREAAYLRKWLGKIYVHYQGSRTRLIFVKLPRGPVVRPDLPPPNLLSSVRALAAHSEVALLPEHAFETLEKPILFWDFMHLNQAGAERFSHMAAREVRAVLGPPR